ncbi:MAG: hypothetical protein UZ22_OP11002000222 [Microgenomates bacterium OLB23]|nr:MAG: hypothetical protein UZ22_OP11002000222 [Microgenomates bacterium OLB23]
MHTHQPYLIIPKLISQPTWGGRYIFDSKGWSRDLYEQFRIGQSYELFNGSKLATGIFDSSSPEFLPEIGNPDSQELVTNNPLVYSGSAHIVLEELVAEYKDEVLGAQVWQEHYKMPLLIKLNQSRGNSFQLHIKSGTHDVHWKPKPESWYFFENGSVTYGLKPGIDLNRYKQTCEEIANFMQQLSESVRTSQISIQDARNEAKMFIEQNNPHQFVNTLQVPQDSVVDLSAGGVHHSWEEDQQANPHGNIVYEIQHDVMDPVCTIRSFDQGKIKDDGSVRTLHIADYFTYIDTDPQLNNPQSAFQEQHGEHVLSTPYYNMDKIDLSAPRDIVLDESFHHLYVKSGKIELTAHDVTLTIGAGHSAFVPFGVNQYKINPLMPSSVLTTYISAK